MTDNNKQTNSHKFQDKKTSKNININSPFSYGNISFESRSQNCGWETVLVSFFFRFILVVAWSTRFTFVRLDLYENLHFFRHFVRFIYSSSITVLIRSIRGQRRIAVWHFLSLRSFCQGLNHCYLLNNHKEQVRNMIVNKSLPQFHTSSRA